MSDQLKKGQVSAIGDQPLEFTELGDSDQPSLSDDQRADIHKLLEVFQAYRKASRALLEGKYSHLLEYAPQHLSRRVTVMVARCRGGVVVRFDKPAENPRLICGWMNGSLEEVASLLSQRLICCDPAEDKIPSEVQGIEMTISVISPEGRKVRDISRFRIRFDISTYAPKPDNVSPSRPRPIASVRNTFELGIEGEIIGKNGKLGEGQPFVARSPFRLPVGWECIEVFPVADVQEWDPDESETWAESDILAAVAARQFREAQYQALDPNAGARKRYAQLLDEFKQLLNSDPDREEILQVFLRQNPVLICPTQTKMWPKLALGDKQTDFVFRDAVGDYLLVELEKSTHSLFRADGHAKNELNIARGQILDWKRYIEDNLNTVQSELGLKGISSNPRSLIVIGRSASLTEEDNRKLRAMENENPKQKIMTYDELYENAKAIIENLLGAIFDPGGTTQIYYLERGEGKGLLRHGP